MPPFAGESEYSQNEPGQSTKSGCGGSSPLSHPSLAVLDSILLLRSKQESIQFTRSYFDRNVFSYCLSSKTLSSFVIRHSSSIIG
jgi:hypothetical protein